MTPEYSYTRTRQNRVKSGVCRDCGKVPPLANKVSCENCSKKRNDFSREHKRKRKVNGLCTRCGKPHTRNKMLCLECNENQIEDFRQRRKFNKLKVVEYFGGKCCECGSVISELYLSIMLITMVISIVLVRTVKEFCQQFGMPDWSNR